MKTHSYPPALGSVTEGRRAAVCFGCIALTGAGTMLALWLLALLFGLGERFAEYHHQLGLVSLLLGLGVGSAWFDRWERKRDRES